MTKTITITITITRYHELIITFPPIFVFIIQLVTLKAKGWIVFILLWSRVIFFKFFNPLNACKCIFVCVCIFIQLDFLSGRFPHFLRQLEIPPDLSSLDTFSLVKTSEIIVISFYCYYLVFLIVNHCHCGYK